MNHKRTEESPPTSSVVKPKGLFEAVEEELRLRNYSPKTAKVYLGHARLETTSVYTKVRNPNLLKIRSPL